MEIGFGEFYIALSFLLVTLFVSYGLGYVGKRIILNTNTRLLTVEIKKEYAAERLKILTSLEHYSTYQTVSRTEKKENGNIALGIDINVKQSQMEEFENFLIGHEAIECFEI